MSNKGRKPLPSHLKKKMFSFRIDREILKRLSYTSKKTGRSMSYLIEISVKKFLNEIKLPE